MQFQTFQTNLKIQLCHENFGWKDFCLSFFRGFKQISNFIFTLKIETGKTFLMPFRAAPEALEQIIYKIGTSNIFVLYFAAVSSGALILFLLIIWAGKIFVSVYLFKRRLKQIR